MSLVSLLIVLVVVGFVAWLILQVPLPAPVRNIILGVIVLFLVLWVLQQFGLIAGPLRLRLN